MARARSRPSSTAFRCVRTSDYLHNQRQRRIAHRPGSVEIAGAPRWGASGPTVPQRGTRSPFDAAQQLAIRDVSRARGRRMVSEWRLSHYPVTASIPSTRRLRDEKHRSVFSGETRWQLSRLAIHLLKVRKGGAKLPFVWEVSKSTPGQEQVSAGRQTCFVLSVSGRRSQTHKIEVFGIASVQFEMLQVS